MANLKALVAKTDYQHVLLVLAFVATVGIPDLVKAESLLGFSQYAPVTLKIGTYLAGLLMLLKQSKPTPDTIQAAQAKLGARGFVQVRVLQAVTFIGFVFALTLAACAAFRASAVPGDLQKDEECVAAQLLEGNSNVASIGLNCSMPEGKTLLDLVALLVDALGGKVAPAQKAALMGDLAARRAAAASHP